ncbi:MAG: hypothetical protein JWL59_4919 [Chthoniobacteraceae bacterium]|nr:hypothetical protein [Chthoniobacteraceae bacterium]
MRLAGLRRLHCCEHLFAFAFDRDTWRPAPFNVASSMFRREQTFFS